MMEKATGLVLEEERHSYGQQNEAV